MVGQMVGVEASWAVWVSKYLARTSRLLVTFWAFSARALAILS